MRQSSRYSTYYFNVLFLHYHLPYLFTAYFLYSSQFPQYSKMFLSSILYSIKREIELIALALTIALQT